MAIITPITTQYGIECQYSKITMFNQKEEASMRMPMTGNPNDFPVMVQQSTITVTLSSFLNKETREQNKTPIVSKNITFYIEDFLEKLAVSGMNHIQYIYTMLCQQQGYQGDENIS